MNTDNNQQSDFDRQEEEYKRLEKERTLEPKTEALLKLLENFVNYGGSISESRKLAKAIANGRLHRTLQQSVIRLFLMTLEEMAALPEAHTDARNQASRLISKQMIEGFKKLRSEYDTKLHGRPIDDGERFNPSDYLPFI